MHLTPSNRFLFICLTLGAGNTHGASMTQKDFSPDLSPDGSTAVYYSYHDGGLPDIHAVDLASGAERHITDTEDWWEIEPKWSPDGERIVFAAGPSMDSLEIHTIRPDGSDLTALTDTDVSSSSPQFSPDGRRIVFQRFSAQTDSQLFILDLETGHEQQLDAGEGVHYKPRWSPDGQTILFQSTRNGQEHADLYLLDLAGNVVTQLTDSAGDERFPTWHPTGDRVIFNYTEPDQPWALFQIARDGSHRTKLYEIDDGDVNFSAVSADGKKILFDAGNWSDSFFLYEASLNQPITSPRQVTGHALQERLHKRYAGNLGPMVGRWRAETVEGRSAGRLTEEVDIRWGEGEKYLIVDMTMLWDGEPFNQAHGMITVDPTTDVTTFTLVMADGGVITQVQENAGEIHSWEMNGTARSSGFPAQFRSELTKGDEQSWSSRVTHADSGNLIAARQYSRVP